MINFEMILLPPPFSLAPPQGELSSKRIFLALTQTNLTFSSGDAYIEPAVVSRRGKELLLVKQNFLRLLGTKGRKTRIMPSGGAASFLLLTFFND